MRTAKRPTLPALALTCGAAALLVVGCSMQPPAPGESGTMNPDGSDADIGSYSIMAEWDGCTALANIEPVKAFMGVTDWGTNGLTSHDIPGGMDGEAFNCGAFLAQLPAYERRNEVTGNRTHTGHANIDIGVAPWDSEGEAATNFDERVEQLAWAIDTGGTEYANVVEGQFPTAGDWDQTYVHGGNSSIGYVLSAIARRGDLVIYAFIDYITDPGVQSEADPVYPFTDASLTTWILEDYLPEVYHDVMALKAEGTQAGIAAP